MSAPRTKRPFAGDSSDPEQRQITSFFLPSTSRGPSTSGSDSRASHNGSNRQPLNGPSLPATVQSNLLSVGMRVRKSVPEGYKTGSPYGGFSLWSDEPAVEVRIADDIYQDDRFAMSTPKSKPHHPPSVGRELLPFCGIHSVGGMSSQPAFDDSPSLEDLPSLTSSQESVQSTSSQSSMKLLSSASANAVNAARNNPGRKRLRGTGYCADDDDVEHDTSVDVPAALGSDRPRLWRYEIPDGEVSPRSLAPAAYGNARVFAAPRKRRGAGGGDSVMTDGPSPSPLLKAQLPLANGGGDGGALSLSGQENMNVVVDDFGEAEFLDYQPYSPDMKMEGV